MTKKETRHLWKARIAEYKSSGQSASTWCAAHNLNPRQLWYWLRKEKQGTSETTALSWLPVKLNDENHHKSLLVKVGQVTVEVKPGFDPKLLLDVVKTLSAQ